MGTFLRAGNYYSLGIVKEVYVCVWKREDEWVNLMGGMGAFNSDDHYIYYCRQESHRRNGEAIMVNKTVQRQYLDEISKTKEWSLFISKANHSISQ